MGILRGGGLSRKESLQGVSKFWQVAGVALPNNKDLPAEEAEFFEISTVASNISPAFSLPPAFSYGKTATGAALLRAELRRIRG